jgi:hypothetical protein
MARWVPQEHREKIIDMFLDPQQGPFAAQAYADKLELGLRHDYAYQLMIARGLLPKTRQININEDEVDLVKRCCALVLAQPPSRYRVAAETLLNKMRVRNE